MSNRALRAVLFAGVLALIPTVVAAHVELVESSPAEGAQLTDPPTEVVLTFDEEVADDAAFTVTDADGAEVGTGELDLDVVERNVVHGEVSITEPGAYTVAWNATGDDGDPVEGTFAFTLLGPGEQPNTALPSPGTGVPLTAIGLLLVTAGLALAIRRVPQTR